MPAPPPALPDAPAAATAPVWDLFCRVIDNHGDLGVCWRLARGLAARGIDVRLWVDDPAALAWMAPGLDHPPVAAHGPRAAHAPGDITLRPWPPGPGAGADDVQPGEVVIEAFGCDPPPLFVARMARRRPAPVWINLEYLSAEPYAERSHRLPSPQSAGPGRGLTKWFFYPGFSAASGGLIHGDAARPAATLPSPGVAAAPPHGRERQVLLFGYGGGPWPALLACIAADGPACIRVPPGAVHDELASLPMPPGLRRATQPLVPQPAFDELLAAVDLAIVRGEDSFARAQLAADTPWLWQIYPQHDGAHAAKLDAFLARFLAEAPPALAGPLGMAFRALNGLGPWPRRLPDAAAWRAHQRRWRAGLLAQPDLVDRLIGFAAEKSGFTAEAG